MENYTIHDDVLLTDSGTAYLIGGNHSVLNYITEKTKPTGESLNNFSLNIARRGYMAHLRKSKFLHVIFPDKQSVLSEDFPIKNTIRLGDKYLESLADIRLKNIILYPADYLKSAGGDLCFQKLDTHLSDYGSLIVLKQILNSLNEPAAQALVELQKSINLKKRTSGDLGSKLTPRLFQDSVKINPDWNHQKFFSNGEFNNGQIDIYLSVDAIIPKKVLIFGDSFFRLMLSHLSKIFREVIFLRTPYFHPEMVDLIQPDIILTGNSERYLANVSSDINAPAFQIYSYSHHLNNKPSMHFINAFRAVTSPNAKASKRFFNYIFDEEAQPKIIAGPSHMVRWKQHLVNKILKKPCQPSNLVGFGGAPIWSKRLIDSVKNSNSAETKILLMVGDFRFGNEVCLHPSRSSLPLFLPNFSGINAKAISDENDAFMLNRCISALTEWNSNFNNQIKFLFWDLFCRQVQDRLAGRHIVDKKYNHPHWNLAPIQATVPPHKLIDLLPLLSLPMHEAVRLFIDASSHPSQIGYLLITNTFFHGSDAMTAYNKAVADVEKIIFSAVDSLVARSEKPITICGRSVWIDTFIRYLGPSGLEAIAEKGLTLIPFNSQIGHPKDITAKDFPIDKNRLFYISEHGALSDAPLPFNDKIARTEWVANPSNSFAWEGSCAGIITKRNEIPRSLYGHLDTARLDFKPLELTDADVELGPFGYPTLNGILKLLESIGAK